MEDLRTPKEPFFACVECVTAIMTDSQGNKVIVCDNGTGFVKCGYAKSNFPSHVFPSLVGRPILRSSTTVEGIEVKVRVCMCACVWLCLCACVHVCMCFALFSSLAAHNQDDAYG